MITSTASLHSVGRKQSDRKGGEGKAPAIEERTRRSFKEAPTKKK